MLGSRLFKIYTLIQILQKAMNPAYSMLTLLCLLLLKWQIHKYTMYQTQMD